MRLEPWLCLGSLEIANNVRTSTYVTNSGIAGMTMATSCGCDVFSEEYTLPATDPAPWYEASRPESAEFMGYWAHSITLDSVLGRTVQAAGTAGGAVSPLRLKYRNVFVDGLMLASSAQGMQYGERWLNEALRGSPCDDDSPTDALGILPVCPSTDDLDYDGASAWFRDLYNTGLIDGPIFTPEGDGPECYYQRAAFTLTAGVPWLYHPPTRVLDGADASSGAVYADLTTTEWMGDGTFIIDISCPDDSYAYGGDAANNVTIVGAVSMDGSCPRGDNVDDVMPCFSYTIPHMSPGDRIVIDGVRREVRWYGAAAKTPTSGLRYIDFEGSWIWPDVGVCTTVCVEIQGTGGVTATVDTYLREV